MDIGSDQHEGLREEFFTTRLIQRRHTEENIFAAIGIRNSIDQFPARPKFDQHSAMAEQKNNCLFVATHTQGMPVEFHRFKLQAFTFECSIETALSISPQAGFRRPFFRQQNAASLKFLIKIHMILNTETIALASRTKHFIPLALCGGRSFLAAIRIDDFQAQYTRIVIQQFAKELMRQMRPMRMIDDDAAAIWNHQCLKHGVKRLSPRHLRSDMNAMLSQYGTSVAIVVAAGEKTAWARDMQIDIVV